VQKFKAKVRELTERHRNLDHAAIVKLVFDSTYSDLLLV